MKWNKKDCFGNEQIWYSVDVIERIKKIVAQLYYNDLIKCEKSLDEILDELHKVLELIESEEEEINE